MAQTLKYQRLSSQPENPFSSLIAGNQIGVIPSFTLESGVNLQDVPVAYKTWGQLDDQGNNAMLICHALSGSADVADWWGPLIGPGKAFDTSRFFVVCCNSLGSPYGSASPVTKDSTTGNIYGPEFPLTTVRDDVSIHKLLLDDLGVKEIAVVIGGSMGGMLTLEWAFLGKDYVKAIVPIATSSRHSAWCISWGEAQRQSISVDPKYEDGYYSFDNPPVTGLGAARMSALLTYRSRNSFESRFGRNAPDPTRHRYINSHIQRPPITPSEEHWAVHNAGFQNVKRLASQPDTPMSSAVLGSVAGTQLDANRKEKDIAPGLPPSLLGQPSLLEAMNGALNSPSTNGAGRKKPNTDFSTQTYLRYQGSKFVKRFDANCYISITRKLDTHDISRGRTNDDVRAALALIQQPTLVIGIESDGLFTYAEQEEIAACVPNARLATIDSPEGHDAFLLEFEEINKHIVQFLGEVLPNIMERPGSVRTVVQSEQAFGGASTVGEVDEITAW